VLTVTRERYYGAGQRGFFYRASLNGTEVATGKTAKEAKEKGFSNLAQSHKHILNMSAARVARDGTVLIVREYADGQAHVEYNRQGVSGSSAMGTMTNGMSTFRTVQEYADYLLAQYQD